jgi:hypothetical protein
MSALPPAPNATTTRTGWEGQSSARADASIATSAQHAAAIFKARNVSSRPD